MLWKLLSSRMLVFMMAAPTDGGGGGNGGDGDDSGGDDADANADSKKPKDANGGGQQPGGEDEDAKLQEKLNKLLPDRAKQYLRTEILAPLGFKTEKDLKAALDKLKGIEDSEKTELQKAQERITELEKATQQRDAALRKHRIETEVERAARTLKFRDPQDAIVHLQAELTEAEVTEDGKLKGVEELLKKLAKAKPYLIDNGKESPDIDSRTDSKKQKEQDEEALRSRYHL